VNSAFKVVRPKTCNQESSHEGELYELNKNIEKNLKISESSNQITLKNLNSNFGSAHKKLNKKTFLYEPTMFSTKVIKQW
jgi:hypothetical protein